MKIKTSSLLIAGALFGAAVMPAQANNEAMMDLLKVLRDQGTITSANYELLSNAAKADKEATDATASEVKKATESMPKITTKGKIKVESPDGNWSFQPIGRVMWDYIATDEDGAQDDFTGTELRRARLGFQGKIYDWGYKFEGDFAKGGTSIKDAYVSYGTKLNGMKTGVKIGQSHIPFGINTKISSKYMSFMDRPWYADSELSPARQSGVVASLADKKYKWAVSAGYTIGEISGGSTDEDASGDTLAIRGSFVPYQASKKQMVQLGAGYMNTSDADEGYSFSQRLVSHKDSHKYLKTSGDYNEYDAFTVDALGIFGSFHALAEYVDGTLEGSGTDGDVSAYSVEAGYFLTGESLKWKKGYTSGITPKSSSGAWQVAFRFENMEIDETGADDEATKYSFGVNYYPTQNTRLMLNYDITSDIKENGTDINDEPSALKFRAQVYW